MQQCLCELSGHRTLGASWLHSHLQRQRLKTFKQGLWYLGRYLPLIPKLGSAAVGHATPLSQRRAQRLRRDAGGLAAAVGRARWRGLLELADVGRAGGEGSWAR